MSIYPTLLLSGKTNTKKETLRQESISQSNLEKKIAIYIQSATVHTLLFYN